MCICVFAGCSKVTTDHLQHFKMLTELESLKITGEQASLISGQESPGSWIRKPLDSLRRIQNTPWYAAAAHTRR